jgi:hypothetical protein
MSNNVLGNISGKVESMLDGGDKTGSKDAIV